MKIPRDLSGEQLIKILVRRGYRVVDQVGSHVKLMHPGPPKHTVAVPLHGSLKVGTLNSILSAVSRRLGISKEDLLNG